MRLTGRASVVWIALVIVLVIAGYSALNSVSRANTKEPETGLECVANGKPRGPVALQKVTCPRCLVHAL